MGKHSETEEIKKPLSPFFLYRKEVYDKVKAENNGAKTT
jgi:hypothetical protein